MRPKKLCECGCGKPVTASTNRFLWGHNNPWYKKSPDLKGLSPQVFVKQTVWGRQGSDVDRGSTIKELF